MASSLSMEEVHRQNYEKSLFFMQEEHAKTLKDLHEEIRKLQARCSELTFQNAMNSTYQVDEDQYTQKIGFLESELASMKARAAQFESSSSGADRDVISLRTQLATAERKLEEERRKHNADQNSLRRELDSRATTVARLTAQLHHIKRVKAARTAEAEETLSSPPEPAPPTSARARKHRTYRPLSAASNTSDSPREGSPRQLPLPPPTSSLNRRSFQLAFAHDPNMPDPAPFIQANFTPAPPRDLRPSKVPLPPIKHGRQSVGPVVENLKDTSPSTAHTRLTSQVLFTPSPKRGSLPSERVGSAVEVQRLAVGKVPKSRCGYQSPAAGGDKGQAQ